MDEITHRKIRNAITTAPKLGLTWRDLYSNQNNNNEMTMMDPDKLKILVLDFLKLVSGGEITKMLSDILHSSQRDHIPQILQDASGRRRLEKLNTYLKQSPPLKPWSSLRGEHSSTESKIRIEVEVTARRCLSYLSGGHIVGILKDILYEEEKERIANRYRLAIIRIGEVLKVNSSFKPKQKGLLLDAMKQAGFDKDELRERGWTFSNHLWNSCGKIHVDTLPLLVPRNRTMSNNNHHNNKRSKYERHLISETRFHRTRLYDLLSNEENDDEDDQDMEIATLSASQTTSSEPSPKRTNNNNGRTVMRFNNYTNREFSASSSSEDEEEVEQKRRLELKNPMFPKI